MKFKYSPMKKSAAACDFSLTMLTKAFVAFLCLSTGAHAQSLALPDGYALPVAGGGWDSGY